MDGYGFGCAGSFSYPYRYDDTKTTNVYYATRAKKDGNIISWYVKGYEKTQTSSSSSTSGYYNTSTFQMNKKDYTYFYFTII